MLLMAALLPLTLEVLVRPSPPGEMLPLPITLALRAPVLGEAGTGLRAGTSKGVPRMAGLVGLPSLPSKVVRRGGPDMTAAVGGNWFAAPAYLRWLLDCF